MLFLFDSHKPYLLKEYMHRANSTALCCIWLNEVWSTYLSPTEADVERMEVFGALGGEAGAVHQGPHRPQGAEVEARGHVAVRVAELTVAET